MSANKDRCCCCLEVIITVLIVKALLQCFVSSSCMLLDKKTLIEFGLISG